MGFISLIAVYGPTEMCGFEEKEMFFAKLNSILDQFPPRDTLWRILQNCRVLSSLRQTTDLL